jgi:hypothetical protein
VDDARRRRMNRNHFALAATLVFGALLRFAHLDFGFPGSYHPDEWRAAIEVDACSKGRPAERRYRHPPLQKNLACLVAPSVRRLLPGEHTGWTVPVFSLRLVSAAAGSLAPLFVYLVTRRFVPGAAALGAAFLYAVFPAAVVTSKYGPPDSLVSTLVLASLWLHLRLVDRRGAAAVFAAALATTLAVAAKYNAGFLAFSFAAAWIEGWRRGVRPLLAARPAGAAAAAVLLGLALGFPAVLFSGELANLVSGISGEGGHLLTEGHYGIAIGLAEGLGVFHLGHSVLPASGPLLLAAIVAGLAALATRRDAPSRVLLAFAIPCYAAIEFAYKVPPSYERYMLPLLGVFLCGAMLPLWFLAERSAARLAPGRAPAMVLGLTALLAAFPLLRTVEVVAAMRPDTRELLSDRMPDLLPAEAAIFAESPMMMMYYPMIDRPVRPEPAVAGLLETERSGSYYVLASSLLYERYEDFPDQKPEWTRFYRELARRGTLVAEQDAGGARYMFHNPTLKLYRVDAQANP